MGIRIFLPDYEWRLQEFLGVRLSWLAGDIINAHPSQGVEMKKYSPSATLEIGSKEWEEARKWEQHERIRLATPQGNAEKPKGRKM